MSNLIHAVARVRALESGLLTPSHVDRMIGSPTFKEAYTVLDDLGYALDASRSRSNFDFEEVLESGLYEAKEVFSFFGIKDVFSVLTVLWDIQNIKLALKALKKGESEEEVESLMVSYGSYTLYEVIQGVFHGRGLSNLFDILSAAKIAESNKKMEEGIEEGLFSLARKNAKGDVFLLKYISLLEEAEAIRADIVKTGNIRETKENFSNTSWKSVLEKADIITIETSIDEYILSFLRSQSQGQIDGYAPLFSYYWRKERNTRVIRSILLAKRAGISGEEIRGEFPQFEF